MSGASSSAADSKFQVPSERKTCFASVFCRHKAVVFLVTGTSFTLGWHLEASVTKILRCYPSRRSWHNKWGKKGRRIPPPPHLLGKVARK